MTFAIVCSEVLLILTGISFPLLYQTDNHCGVRLKRNLNVRYIEEGTSIVRTNSAGFRDVERSRTKPAGIYRIAVLGDSFSEAIQVDREKSFCYLLEQHLISTGAQVEVLNFGVSGFGTSQEFELLKNEVVDYQPDLVILAMFLGNDIGDNSRAINPGQIKPYHDWVDGKLVLDDSFQSDPRFLAAQSSSTQLKSRVINASRTVQLINKLYSRLKNSSQPRANVGIGLDPKLYAPPEDDDWKSAWNVTERLVSAIDEHCQQNQSRLVVVTLTNPIQVHPDAAVRDKFKNDHEIDSLLYPDDRVRQYCAKNRIHLLQLARPFLQEVIDSREPVYFHGFTNTELGVGHWNELGHRRASESLATYLLQKKFVQ